MSKIRITDLTLRDAHQSLFATRMLTSDMLPVAKPMDRAGFWSLETWGGATFDSCIRFLNEDPWERIRALKAAMPNTPMQMLLRGQNLLGYRHYGDDVVEAFVERAAANGVDVFRVFDALNDARNMQTSFKAVKKAGKHAQATLSYATSPVHSIDSFVSLARELQTMGADSLCIKDMAGLLKPYDAYTLVKALKKAVDLPVQIHSHATTGMSVATLVKAIEAGADGIDTAIASMAMGTSHSPTETMVEILAGTEYDTGLDLKSLVEVSAYFREVRKKYKAFESSFVGADPRILVAQVPGGMLSNLESQLKEQNALDKLDAVLEEISVVQKDFGYPPLVTPTSQITGTQAVLNVLFGRYAQLSNESKNLLAGNYGKTPAKPNADLVARALKELNLKEAVTCRPADLIPNEFHKLEEELRQKMGVATVTREDVLTYAMFPQVALGFFKTRANGPVKIEAPKAEAPAPVADKEHKHFLVMVDGVEHQVSRLSDTDGNVHLHVNGTPFKVSVAKAHSPTAVAATPTAPNATAAKVLAPMPGKILSLSVPEGARVEKDQPICTMEALKMEMAIKTPQAGTVRFVAKEGSAVKAGDVLAEIV
jgi:oxaloacetate decarboxylase (Na+ extruding) subunit alpha